MSNLAEKLTDTLNNDEEKVEEIEGATDLVSDRKWNVIFGQEIDSEDAKTEGVESANKDSNIRHKRLPIIFFLPQKTSREYFVSLKKWKCVVTGIEDETFWAKLVDMDKDEPDEEAEIYKSELSEEDIGLLSVGAVFYWSIGYHTAKDGQRKRESIIRFRRLPVWSRSELEGIRKRAQKLLSGLNIK